MWLWVRVKDIPFSVVDNDDSFPDILTYTCAETVIPETW